MKEAQHRALRFLGPPEVAKGPLNEAWSTVPRSPEGIPILLEEREAYLEAVGSDLSAPLDALSFGASKQISSYLKELASPTPSPLHAEVLKAIENAFPEKAPLAIELGASLGILLRHISPFFEELIGLDLRIESLRVADAQLHGKPVPYLQRKEGRHFSYSEDLTLPPLKKIPSLLVGNALNPPFNPYVANAVIALNLLDCVSHPLNLIGQMDAILKPGGLFILSSPFNWEDHLTPPHLALGGGTAPEFFELGTERLLRRLLEGQLPDVLPLKYEILNCMDLPWQVPIHERAQVTYTSHLIVAKKKH